MGFLFLGAAHRAPQSTSGTEMENPPSFCQEGPFWISHLGSWGCTFPSPNQKWGWSMYRWPGRWQGGKKALLWPLLAPQESGGQCCWRDSGSLCPQVPAILGHLASREGQPGAASQQRGGGGILVCDPQWRHSDPLEGLQSRWPGGYTACICAPHHAGRYPAARPNRSEFSWGLPPFFFCQSEFRASHPHVHLPKPPPSSGWSKGKPKFVNWRLLPQASQRLLLLVWLTGVLTGLQQLCAQAQAHSAGRSSSAHGRRHRCRRHLVWRVVRSRFSHRQGLRASAWRGRFSWGTPVWSAGFEASV